MVERVEHIIKKGQENSEIKDIDASMIAYMLLNLIRFILFDLKDEREYKKRKEQMVSFFINGIKNEEGV